MFYKILFLVAATFAHECHIPFERDGEIVRTGLYQAWLTNSDSLCRVGEFWSEILKHERYTQFGNSKFDVFSKDRMRMLIAFFQSPLGVGLVMFCCVGLLAAIVLTDRKMETNARLIRSYNETVRKLNAEFERLHAAELAADSASGSTIASFESAS